MVDWRKVTFNPESVLLPVEWVITIKGSVECHKPTAARLLLVSSTVTVFWYARLPIARSWDLEGCQWAKPSAKELKIVFMVVTAAFSFGFSERPLFMKIPKEYTASHNYRLRARFARSLDGTRDAAACGTL